jgi:ADP-ribosylglycohydrolase
MLGAICGDVIGAPYEVTPVTYRDFILLADNGRITDDTVCTCAVAHAVLSGSMAFGDELKHWAKSFSVPYGERFEAWIHSEHDVNDSAGNGSVSRVSSIPWLAPDLRTALDWAARSAMTSHRHPDSVTAAMAVSASRDGARQRHWRPSVRHSDTNSASRSTSSGPDTGSGCLPSTRPPWP